MHPRSASCIPLACSDWEAKSAVVNNQPPKQQRGSTVPFTKGRSGNPNVSERLPVVIADDEALPIELRIGLLRDKPHQKC